MATTLSDRAIIYSGIIVQSAVAAIFFSDTGNLLAPYHYGLTLPQYGALFIPQLIAAFIAALYSTSLGNWLTAEHAYRAGLSCGLAGMVLLVATEWAKRTGFTYPLLLAAAAFVGAGFGLSFPCVRCYAVSLKPLRARRQILLLNALVAVGLAVAPIYAFLTRGTAWWSLPVVLGILLIAEIVLTYSLHAPLDGPTGQRENLRAPTGFRFYPGLALVYAICAVACLTAPHYLTGPVPTARHVHVVVLAEIALWAALLQGSRVVFALIDSMKSRQRTASVSFFMIAIVLLILSMSVTSYDIMHIALYLLAVIGSAALLPIDTRPGHEHLAVVPLAVTAVLFVLFPAGVGLSRLGYDIVARTGMSSFDLFLTVALVGAAACILLLPIILNWSTIAYFELPANRYAQPPGAGQSGAVALPGPPAAPRPRRPPDHSEADSEGRKARGASALPQGPQRDSRRKGR